MSADVKCNAWGDILYQIRTIVERSKYVFPGFFGSGHSENPSSTARFGMRPFVDVNRYSGAKNLLQNDIHKFVDGANVPLEMVLQGELDILAAFRVLHVCVPHSVDAEIQKIHP